MNQKTREALELNDDLVSEPGLNPEVKVEKAPLDIRQVISKFAYSESPTKTEGAKADLLKSTPLSSETYGDTRSTTIRSPPRLRYQSEKERKLPVTPESPRKRRKNDSEEQVARSTSPKKKRGYAPPETYAHLNCLQDYLKEDLDGMSKSMRRILLFTIIYLKWYSVE